MLHPTKSGFQTMSSPSRQDPDASANTAATSVSSAAEAVEEALRGWRARIAEAQTLARLTLSLLKGSAPLAADRAAHLASLLTIEHRALAGLPTLDLPSLRHTTSARQSGIDLHAPDPVLAEQYLLTQVELVRATIARVASQMAAERTSQSDLLELALRTLEDLSRTVDLVDATLRQRVQNPVATLETLLDRAIESRGQTVTLEGNRDTLLPQPRGLVRLLSEIVASVGDNAYVYAAKDGNGLRVTVSPLATGYSSELVRPGAIHVLRLAAYLLRIVATYRDGAWELNLLATA